MTARPGQPRVVLSASPGELLLYLFGRQAVAQVKVIGSPDAIAALRRTRIGM